MNFQLKTAEQEQFEAVVQVIWSVWEQVENKDWFSVEDLQGVYDELTEKRGIAYLAVEEESKAIAGIFITSFPGDGEENLGKDIGMDKRELLQVAHMDYAAVLPEYRGHRLQFRLMQMGEENLKKLGYRYLMCTVHPENRYSLNNVMEQGYQVAATKKKYGGVLRHILIKEM